MPVLPTGPLVVGYGTLMSRASAGRTLSAAVEERGFFPVVVPGFRRLYNLRPEHYQPSLRLSQAPVEVAAANVQPAPGSCFNGLAFRVSSAELPVLDDRERYYARIQVPVLSFPDERPVGDAFVYSAGEGSPWVVGCDADLLPRWEDLLLARGGAYRLSHAFGVLFDQTSFLADGRTRVMDRYAPHLPPPMEGSP